MGNCTTATIIATLPLTGAAQSHDAIRSANAGGIEFDWLALETPLFGERWEQKTEHHLRRGYAPNPGRD